MEIVGKLPVFGSHNELSEAELRNWRLKVDGLVVAPAAFSYEAILSWPAVNLTSDFICIEGWKAQNIKWRGVRVRDLAAKVGASDEAKYVTLHAGSFIVSLPITAAMADNVILAHQLDGVPIPRAHGGPLRLVSPVDECYYSTKWVERVEFAASNASDTGQDIALGRIGKR